VSDDRICAAYRARLLDRLGADGGRGADGTVPDAQRSAAALDVALVQHAREQDVALAQHARSCTACAAAERELHDAWRAFDALPALAPPPALAARTRAAVLANMDADARGASRRRWYEAARMPLAVLSSLLVTGATLALLGGLIWGSALPGGHLFFCAAIYTGLLVAAFSWIYSATSVGGVHLDAAARVGVIALAITIAATTMCPEFHVLAWWDRSTIGGVLSRVLGAGGSSLVFGFGYGLVPGFLAALFGGKLAAERPLANGLVAAAVVFLLALPVVYLQTAPFTSGVIASWVAGTAAGTLCGVFGAQRVRRRTADTPLAAA
jgi:hypothetical protein